MTPATHERAVQQIHERAMRLEETGDLARALAIYQGALVLVGEHDRFILSRIDLLKEKIDKVAFFIFPRPVFKLTFLQENVKNAPAAPIPAPEPVGEKKSKKKEREEDDEEYEPGTIEKKKKTKTAAKRERKDGSKQGSFSKKIKVGGRRRRMPVFFFFFLF
jgi:hypothetical protein